MTEYIDYAIAALLFIGGSFALVGAIGLVRLPTALMRVHAPTKASTVGVGAILIGSMLFFAFDEQAFSLREILITLFIFLTAPVSAHLIARAALYRQRERQATLKGDTVEAHGWNSVEAVDASSEPGGTRAQ